eukprot:Tamp_21597.p1 GENE.Tamp_21597~~Tamp_21597.p1  ORF type:complete len:359 (-),score=75.45 Tamp_21597:59-1135(-)
MVRKEETEEMMLVILVHKEIKRDEGRRWDAVIDFVCFRKKGMKDIVAQAQAIEHYIFISTDSVYMACDRDKVLAQQGDGGLPEEAAYPATTKLAKSRAKENNEYQYEYGGGKLSCEHLLKGEGGDTKRDTKRDAKKKGRSCGGFSRWTILRLPDVIGPWDNLGSLLRLQQDLLAGRTVGTKVGAACGRISIIGAADVARAILAVLRVGERAHGKTLHIACTEKPTFREFVLEVANALGVQAVTNPEEEGDMVTVDVGPLANEAAVALLAWHPTPLRQTVEETVEWYKDAGNRQYTTAFDESSSSSSSSSSCDDVDRGGAQSVGDGGANSARSHGGGDRVGKRAWADGSEGSDFKFDFH